MRAMLDLILDLLYPPKCMLCGRVMERGADSLCPKCCNTDLPEPERDPKPVQYFEQSVATFFYRDPLIDAILRYKFHGMASYSDRFAKWMAVTVRDKLDGKYDLISWVPCSRRRIRSRGFDQAELLAKALAHELGTEAVRTLDKIRHNPKQSRTADPAKRRANVLGVYRAHKPERFRGKRILLVDDVLTTGATLSECGKVLLIAGADKLYSAVLAAAHAE